MLKIADREYADTNDNLTKINIEAWTFTGASKVDYNIGKGYGVFLSSIGKRVGAFEIVQSKAHNEINYHGGQFIIGMHGNINKLGWGISKRGTFRSDAMLTMLASERVLQKDWDSPEEDAAWENL